MECFLNGPIQSCEYSTAGLRYVFIGNYEDIGTIEYDKELDTITAFTMTSPKKMYYFDVLGSFAEANESMTDTDFGFQVEQNFTMDLAKMDYLKRMRIQELSHSDVFVITVDNNDKKFIYGENNGLRLDNSSSRSGRNGTDFNGYNVNLRGFNCYYGREVDVSLEDLNEYVFVPVPPTPLPLPIDCNANSGVTWGATTGNQYFNELADCFYYEFA